MSHLDWLALLLAISTCLNLGSIATIVQMREGAGVATAALYGAGVAAGGVALYLTAVTAYR